MFLFFGVVLKSSPLSFPFILYSEYKLNIPYAHDESIRFLLDYLQLMFSWFNDSHMKINANILLSVQENMLVNL